jgi:hypothetical protein
MELGHSGCPRQLLLHFTSITIEALPNATAMTEPTSPKLAYFLKNLHHFTTKLVVLESIGVANSAYPPYSQQ